MCDDIYLSLKTFSLEPLAGFLTFVFQWIKSHLKSSILVAPRSLFHFWSEVEFNVKSRIKSIPVSGTQIFPRAYMDPTHIIVMCRTQCRNQSVEVTGRWVFRCEHPNTGVDRTPFLPRLCPNLLGFDDLGNE